MKHARFAGAQGVTRPLAKTRGDYCTAAIPSRVMVGAFDRPTLAEEALGPKNVDRLIDNGQRQETPGKQECQAKPYRRLKNNCCTGWSSSKSQPGLATNRALNSASGTSNNLKP